MKARDEYVLILPLDTDTTVGGIIVDAKKLRYRDGLVVTSGVEDIKEGAKVVYDRANAHDHHIGGKKYKITRARDIAIIL